VNGYDFDAIPVKGCELVWDWTRQRWRLMRPITKRKPPTPDPDAFFDSIPDPTHKIRAPYRSLTERMDHLVAIVRHNGSPMTVRQITDQYAEILDTDLDNEGDMNRLRERVRQTILKGVRQDIQPRLDQIEERTRPGGGTVKLFGVSE